MYKYNLKKYLNYKEKKKGGFFDQHNYKLWIKFVKKILIWEETNMQTSLHLSWHL